MPESAVPTCPPDGAPGKAADATRRHRPPPRSAESTAPAAAGVRARVDDIEAWNDLFAREHDIDDYYCRSGPAIRFIEQRRLACIRRLLAVQTGQRLLEIGCGGGHVLRMFPQCDLTGVDVSGHMLAKARRNLDGCAVRLLKGETSQLNLADESFDRIICTEVLEHTLNPQAILVEIRRLLRPDGRAVITFPNDHLVNTLKGLIRGCRLTVLPPFRRIGWGGDEYHLHTWTIPQMRALLGHYLSVTDEKFAPGRLLPVRCCFAATRMIPSA